MPNKTRFTGNLVSNDNIFSDVTNNRVGIGTTNPTSKLHVVGNVLVTGIVTATTFIGNLTGTATTATLAQGLTGTPNITVGIVTATAFVGDGSGLTNASGSVSISTNTTNSNQLIPYVTSFGSTTGLGATNNMVFNPSTGNLGIGTSNPTSRLEVSGNTTISGDLNISGNIYKSGAIVSPGANLYLYSNFV